MKSKKFIILYVLGLVILAVGLLSISSCKRNKVGEPSVTGPAGFRIILSGTANPSTLYVPETQPAVSSTITVTALNNNATPVAGRTVIFQTGGYGFFENYQISDVRTTNSSGVAQITFFVPPMLNIKSTIETMITVTLSDDGRLDNSLSQVTDYIPVRIIPYAQQALRIHGRILTPSGNGVGEITVLLNGEGGNPSSTTSTRPSGSYEFYVSSGWFGVIEPSSDGYTFNPAQYEIAETNPVITDMDNINFIANFSGANVLAFSPNTWTASYLGDSTTVSVVNKVGDASISYLLIKTAEWIHINPSSGSTPGSFTVTVDPNTTAEDRDGSVTASATDVASSEATLTISQPSQLSSSTGTLAVNPTTINATSAGGDWTISATNTTSTETINFTNSVSDNWLTLSAGTGSTGGATAAFTVTVAANTDSASRTGTVTVTADGGGTAGSPQTVTITQDGTAATNKNLELSQYRIVVPAGNTDNHTITVSTGYASPLNWYIVNNDSWINVTPAYGSTTAPSNTFTIDVQTVNNTGVERSSTIYVYEVNDETFTSMELVQRAN